MNGNQANLGPVQFAPFVGADVFYNFPKVSSKNVGRKTSDRNPTSLWLVGTNRNQEIQRGIDGNCKYSNFN